MNPLFHHIFHTLYFSPILLHIWKFLWFEIPDHQLDLKYERFINLLTHCFFIMRITFLISNNIFWLSFLFTHKSSLITNQILFYILNYLLLSVLNISFNGFVVVVLSTSLISSFIKHNKILCSNLRMKNYTNTTVTGMEFSYCFKFHQYPSF